MIHIEKGKMHSLRVAYETWLNDERFSGLCKLLEKYPCCIGSVALFTSSTHSPLKLGELAGRADVMRLRMQELRKYGVSAGINILTTIGHHEEDLENSHQGEYYHMTGRTGLICRGSYCMNDERYISDFVQPAYNMLANTKPDFIWIDDDIRYGHMPIGYGCFCDGCIEKFNKMNQSCYTRETLTAALDKMDLPLRRAWLDHNKEAITNLFKLIADTVRSVDESVTLGFMTGERYIESYDFPAFADALSDGGKYEIMWRPGGGAYCDYCFDDIVEKSEEIGRQNAYLPSYVCVNQSEIENFPYQLLKKTPVSTALEAAWNMTVGCTGAAFNILPSESGEPIENICAHFDEINRLSSFYQLLNEKISGKQPTGICTAWTPDCQLAVPEGDFVNLSGAMYANFARELFDFGLPQCYSMKDSVVTLASGNFALHWSDNEISKLLSGGVYMDSLALRLLNERGFGAYTGFEQGDEISVDARERYTEHFLNLDICGGIRNCRQAFNRGDAFSLIPTYADSQTLADMVNYHDDMLAQVCQGLFENESGGRISVGGYYPFTWISDEYKTIQLKRLMVYLSGNKLPSFADSYCRVRNHTFVDGENITVVLLNPTNQPLSNIRIAVKTERESFIRYDMNCRELELHSEKTDENGYCYVTLDQLPAYEMRVITTK